MLKKRLAIFGIILCTVITLSVTPTSAESNSCIEIFEKPEFTAKLYPGQSIVHYINMTFPDPFLDCDKADYIPELVLYIQDADEEWYGRADLGLDFMVSPGDTITYPRSVDSEKYMTITVPDDKECGVYDYKLLAKGTYINRETGESLCETNFCAQIVIITVLCDDGIPLFSNAVAILPMAAIVAIIIVQQRRPKAK